MYKSMSSGSRGKKHNQDSRADLVQSPTCHTTNSEAPNKSLGSAGCIQGNA